MKQDHQDKKATIYDIAKLAGTSAATVSRVLSNNGYPVSAGLRQKIIDAAKELNYSPNLLGRMLKKSESREIGVIIPNITNPFYPQLVLGIETEARKHGFGILLCNSFRDAANEQKYIESMYQKQVRGIILSSIGEQHSFLKDYCKKGLKIVGFDQNIDDFRISRIGFNFTRGGIMAVDHLVSLGHKRIAFVSSPLTRKSRQEVFEGYKIGLAKNSLAYHKEYVFLSKKEMEMENGTYEFETGLELARRCIQSKINPTAILAVNDMIALGVIRGLQNSGARVPEDISVIGFDNIEFSSMSNPPLTTISQPALETGKLACRMLIDSILDNNNEVCSITMEPTLIIRESVEDLTKQT